MPASEAGVLLAKATDQEDIKQFITDGVTATGGTAHPDGTKGITLTQLDEFQADTKNYLTWHHMGLIPEDKQTSDIMPLFSIS